MSAPRWDDLHTAPEWADVLDDIAEKLALRYGDYGRHSQIRLAAQCIRDLAQQNCFLSDRVDSAIAANIELHRTVRASVESLGKEPT